MKKLMVLVLICLLLSGCAAPSGNEQVGRGVEFTDALGRTVMVSDPQRIGICSGSFSECWLLAGGEVCAVTRDAVTARDLHYIWILSTSLCSWICLRK